MDWGCLPESMGIHSWGLYDRWHVGPELERDIEGAPQDPAANFPNALVVSPGEPIVERADAQGTAQEWDLPLDIFFIYARTPNHDLLHVCETWADPLHDALCQRQVRRLGDLKFRNSQRAVLGHVTGFMVEGPPDLYSGPDNDALYPVDMACFRQASGRARSTCRVKKASCTVQRGAHL